MLYALFLGGTAAQSFCSLHPSQEDLARIPLFKGHFKKFQLLVFLVYGLFLLFIHYKIINSKVTKEK